MRGLGFGATPSKLNALVHTHNLQSQVQELRNEVKELKALFQLKNNTSATHVGDVSLQIILNNAFYITFFLLCFK